MSPPARHRSDSASRGSVARAAPSARAAAAAAPAPAPAPWAAPAPPAAAVQRAPIGDARARALPFSIATLRAAVPPHCFERSALWSLAYAARDALAMLLCAWAATHIEAGAPALCAAAGAGGAAACAPAARAALWVVYWYACGCFATGWWMIGHECGHGAFSAFPALNYVVGFVAHTSLLVPFSAWAITHARHHGATNSLEHDEPFVPASRASFVARRALGSMLESGAFSLVSLTLMLVLGWPAYLTIDLGGPAKHHSAHPLATRDHFLPTSALFSAAQALPVMVGTCGIAGMLALLAAAAARFGALAVFAYYGVPLLVVNAHLVAITFLQHTHAAVPHFAEGEHSWLRGALCTVDRSWGALRDHLFHHISDTHVCHHLFHEMPFYHAAEATAALRRALGAYYLRDDTPIERALWDTYHSCKFSEADPNGPEGVEWMRDIAEAKRGLKAGKSA